MVDEGFSEVIEEFVEEGNELIENASEDLLDIEKKIEEEIVHRVFRTFHTIKGNAAMLGFEYLASLAHEAENILSMLRNNELEPEKITIDSLLKTLDVLKLLLSDIKSNGEESRRADDLILVLQKIGSTSAPRPTVDKSEIGPKGVTIDLGTDVEMSARTAKKIPVAPSTPKEKIKTLIVDDDFVARHFLSEMLSAYGPCHVAVNGQEAIDAVSHALKSTPPEPYDMICMDIKMPGMDGLEAVERIRKLEKETGLYFKWESSIIMTTALDDPKTVVKAFYKSGASSYLVKPVKPQLLEMEIKKVMAG